MSEVLWILAPWLADIVALCIAASLVHGLLDHAEDRIVTAMERKLSKDLPDGT